MWASSLVINRLLLSLLPRKILLEPTSFPFPAGAQQPELAVAWNCKCPQTVSTSKTLRQCCLRSGIIQHSKACALRCKLQMLQVMTPLLKPRSKASLGFCC
jgi:hypothetical protein